MAVIICNQIYFFTFAEGQRRGHSKKLYKKRSRLDLRKYVFSNRVIDTCRSFTNSKQWDGVHGTIFEIE